MKEGFQDFVAYKVTVTLVRYSRDLMQLKHYNERLKLLKADCTQLFCL